jgi:hypothetical protein
VIAPGGKLLVTRDKRVQNQQFHQEPEMASQKNIKMAIYTSKKKKEYHSPASAKVL